MTFDHSPSRKRVSNVKFAPLVREGDNSPMTVEQSPWWALDVYRDRRPFLVVRNAITTAIRAHFGQQGFLEVETNSLQMSPGNETHLHGLRADVTAPDGVRLERYLRTSPEFALKKLIAAGESKLFELARVYRDREQSALHATEFTMLEWYRANVGYEALMADCADLLRLAAETAGHRKWTFRNRTIDPMADPERLTVAEAFQREAGIDLLATISDDLIGNRDKLADGASKSGITIVENDSWSDIFSKVMVARIEPNIGNGRATILCEYPILEAALARPKPGHPKVAERFEIYACGVELANAFGELTDGQEQLRRFEADMEDRMRIYGNRYPIDDDLIAALGQMPPASGIAMGLDRLVMLAAGGRSLADVRFES